MKYGNTAGTGDELDDPYIYLCYANHNSYVDGQAGDCIDYMNDYAFGFLRAVKSFSTGSKVNVGGTWKPVQSAKVYVNGEWKPVQAMQVNVGGTWRNVPSSVSDVEAMTNPYIK